MTPAALLFGHPLEPLQARGGQPAERDHDDETCVTGGVEATGPGGPDTGSGPPCAGPEPERDCLIQNSINRILRQSVRAVTDSWSAKRHTACLWFPRAKKNARRQA